MSELLIERFRRWFDHERDVHARVIASLESVPEEGRQRAEYQRAVGILGHVVVARKIWLARLCATQQAVGALFPQDPELSKVIEEWRQAEELWLRYLGELNGADLDRVLEYQSLDGSRFRSRVEDILTQLFGHSSYHRGQIAMLVRACGGQPAITDFIYWCREAIPPA